MVYEINIGLPDIQMLTVFVSCRRNRVTRNLSYWQIMIPRKTIVMPCPGLNASAMAITYTYTYIYIVIPCSDVQLDVLRLGRIYAWKPYCQYTLINTHHDRIHSVKNAEWWMYFLPSFTISGRSITQLASFHKGTNLIIPSCHCESWAHPIARYSCTYIYISIHVIHITRWRIWLHYVI